MSVWGKWLCQITVPTGGWAFAYDDGDGQISTIPAGDYASILELCAELEDQMNDDSSDFTVAVSATGLVTVTRGSGWTITWGSTADDLSDLLGFEEDESVSSDVLTATNRHKYGWYPGTISHGVTRGDGVAADSAWRAADEVGRVMAGSGAVAAIKPPRRRYERSVRYGAIRRSEWNDKDRGPALLEEAAATAPVCWYPDRDKGTVASTGTQGDPADDRADSSCDYWLCDVADDPDIQWNNQHPDIGSVAVRVTGRAD